MPSSLLVDTYWWIYYRSQNAAYLQQQGKFNSDIVERWSDHLIVQVRMLNEGGLLSEANLPMA